MSEKKIQTRNLAEVYPDIDPANLLMFVGMGYNPADGKAYQGCAVSPDLDTAVALRLLAKAMQLLLVREAQQHGLDPDAVISQMAARVPNADIPEVLEKALRAARDDR